MIRSPLAPLVLLVAVVAALRPAPAVAYDPHQFTPSSADESWPCPDREGLGVFFESNATGSYAIYWKPLDGGEEVRISLEDAVADHRFPALSPDGTTLVYTRVSSTSAGSLMLLPVSGGYGIELTWDASSTVADWYPTWSADGQRIYFCRRTSASAAWELMQVTLSGQTTSVFLALSGSQTYPHVTSDGQRMIFRSDHQSSIPNLYECPIRTPSTLTKLTTFTSTTVNVIPWAWSPDDTKILFSSKANGLTDLYQLQRSTLTTARLTYDGCGPTVDPATGGGSWSPDGSRIYFDSGRGGGDANVWWISGAQSIPMMTLANRTPFLGRLTPGATYTMTCVLCNFEAVSRTATWCSSDRLGWRTAGCQSMAVPASGSVTLRVTGTVPSTASLCDTNLFTVSVTAPGSAPRTESRLALQSGGPEPSPTGALTLLSPDANYFHNTPVFTPDGQTIIFGSGNCCGFPRLSRIPATGGAEVLLEPPSGISQDYNPRVSRDGTQVVFSRSIFVVSPPPLGPHYETDLYVLPTTGGVATRLTRTGSYAVSYVTPEWSSDGQSIYFVQSISNGFSDIKRYDVATQNVVTFLSLARNQVTPRISNDGLRMVFGSDDVDGVMNVFECEIASPQVLRQLTFESASVAPIDYAPDDSRILCRTRQYNGQEELMELDRGTLAQRRLTFDGETGTVLNAMGDYSPDGGRIVIGSGRNNINSGVTRLWMMDLSSTGLPVCSSCPPDPTAPLEPGGETVIPFRFCNCSSVTGRYTWNLWDDAGWMPARQDSVELAPGQNVTVPAVLRAPLATALTTEVNTLRFHVMPAGNPAGTRDCAVAVSFNPPPTAVALARFEATSEPGGVRLRWAPADEAPLRFHVWRRAAGVEAWERRTERPLEAARSFEYLDTAVATRMTYRYRLEALDRSGRSDWSGELEIQHDAEPALSFGASGSVFSGGVELALVLPRNASVSLAAFDVMGRRLRDLGTVRLEAGSHTVVWDARNDGGREVGGGIYFVRATVTPVDSPRGAEVRTTRVVLVR